jgi:hypothetical protein
MFYAAVAAEGYSVWQPFLAGLLAVWTVACWVRRSPIGHHAFAGLLLVALLYAITYAGVSSTHLAEHDRRYVLEADLVAAWISSPMPVICSPDVPRRVCYRISQTLRIPLARKPEGNGPYYLVSGRGPDHWEEPAAGERSLCGETERYVLWEVRPSDAARQVRPNPE